MAATLRVVGWVESQASTFIDAVKVSGLAGPGPAPATHPPRPLRLRRRPRSHPGGDGVQGPVRTRLRPGHPGVPRGGTEEDGQSVFPDSLERPPGRAPDRLARIVQRTLKGRDRLIVADAPESIGKEGIRIVGGGTGRSGSESGSGSGTVSIGPGGIRVEGSGAGTDGADEGSGSGGVSIGAGGINITGGGRGSERTTAMADVRNCAELCRVWPAVRTRQVECAVVLLEVRGHPVTDTLACEDVETSRECNACRRALDLSDADCRAVFERCIAR
jgi:hypothetical protein